LNRLLTILGIGLLSLTAISSTVGCGGGGEPTRPEELSEFPPEDSLDGGGGGTAAEESEG
jgi:hypothetical protein